MRSFFVLLIVQFASTLLSHAQIRDDFPQDWEKIFNGKDLSGWSIKIQGLPPGINFKNTFRAADGLLLADLHEINKFENRYTLLYFDQELSYYRLRLEYHFVGNQIPGAFKDNDKRFAVMVHTQPPNTLSSKQVIPVGLEINLLGESEYFKNRHTGTLCTPGTSIKYVDGKDVEASCVETNRKSPASDAWVKFEIHVYGDSLLRHYVNGTLALEYTKPCIAEPSKFKEILLGDWGLSKINQPLKGGFVALLVESQSVEFRNIELLNLRGCRNPQCRNFKISHLKQFEGDCDCVETMKK